MRATSSFFFVVSCLYRHRRAFALVPSWRRPLVVDRSRFFCVDSALEDLVRHPAANWDADVSINGHSSPARKQLTVKHAALFASSSLFDEFARTLAGTGVVPRKEVFETWAAALLIDAHAPFAASRRIVDVACGHGLLAWALLVLDDKNVDRPPRTALCVDRRLPASSDAAHAALVARWPHLSDRLHRVEGGLEDLMMSPSCLAVSVHACGTLSDVLVRAAVRAGAPLALVPCCHSRKKLAGFYAEEAADLYEEIIMGRFAAEGEGEGGDGTVAGAGALARALDGARQEALRRAGHDVCTRNLPDKFTAMNTLILASPPPALSVPAPGAAGQRGRRLALAPAQAPALAPQGVEPVTSTTSSAPHRITIPCADTAEARAAVAALAGRAAADRRVRDRAHALLTFDISLWLGPAGAADGTTGTAGVPSPSPSPSHPPPVAETLDAEAVRRVVATVDGGIAADVKLLDEYCDASSSRVSRTFRVCYAAQAADAVLPRDRAVAAHHALYDALPVAFPGVTCRMGKA